MGVFADVPGGQVAGAALAQAFMIVLVVTAAVVGLSAQARRQATERAITSERTAAERAHLLDTVMDNMTEGLVVVQDDGEILVRNPAGRQLVGLDDTPPMPHVLPAASYGLHQLDGTPLPEDQMPSALAFAGHEVVEQDYLLRTPRFPEGRILEMSASHMPESLSDGHQRVIINFRDVTTARQDRENLASFAGVVAHDLINPLSIVDGWAEALNESFLEGPVDPEDGGAMVARILNASKHMRHFIDDLLNYAIARDHTIRRDDLDLSALIEDVASLRRQDNSRPRIHVQEGLRANGDPSMLRQLFDNLLGNAVKYVAPGVRPHILVGGSPEGDFVRLTVDDNGIGVPPEQRRNIFENFQRVATDYSGTGIGLAICARIVGRHGGTIAVEDNPHGDGSRFTLTLPAVVEEAGRGGRPLRPRRGGRRLRPTAPHLRTGRAPGTRPTPRAGRRRSRRGSPRPGRPRASRGSCSSSSRAAVSISSIDLAMAASSRPVAALGERAHLLALDLVGDAQDLQVAGHRVLVHVDADDLLLALLQGDLVLEGRLGDLGGEPALLDAAEQALRHGVVPGGGGLGEGLRLVVGQVGAAEGEDLVEDRVGLGLDLVRQRLDVPAAAEGVGHVDHAGLLHDHLLRAQGDLGGLLAGQRERLVEGVGVQRVGAAEHGRERLDAGADDVVVGLLGGERDAGGLGVEAQPLRLLGLRAVDVADPARPDPAGGAELGDLLEEVEVAVEEEAQPRREPVDVEPTGEAELDVAEARRRG